MLSDPDKYKTITVFDFKNLSCKETEWGKMFNGWGIVYIDNAYSRISWSKFGMKSSRHVYITDIIRFLTSWLQ